MDGAWVGWGGKADLDLEPFDFDGTRLVPVSLSESDLGDYYEGFSNGTIWPLYHDVIATPEFKRSWWDAYVRVNRRFAEAAAANVAESGFVWVHDYQLQLVPQMVRELRPDVTIGYFHHIPFPAYALYAQLPWRRQVLEGLLGADVIGFQRVADAGNFQRSIRRLLHYPTKGDTVTVPTIDEQPRTVIAKSYPISIDVETFLELARKPEVLARAKELREQIGSAKLMLGVDRLDYTKGIRHRLKAYGELLADGHLTGEDATLVQIASPSRPGVEAYQDLRDEIEKTVARINGDYSTVETTAIRYLHQGYPREEMVALYLAADVMLVTALRDGMNLVAKEYVAVRQDNTGVLVLSEFAGAADELGSALLVNPHDIEGMKDIMMRALAMPEAEQARRMKTMRKKVIDNDVARWGRNFVADIEHIRERRASAVALEERIRTVASVPRLLVALDFDGTLSPLVPDPMAARAIPAASRVLERLSRLEGVTVALVSGRSLGDLRVIAEHRNDSLVWLVGSHGSERWTPAGGIESAAEDPRATEVREAAEGIAAGFEGAWIEDKSFGFALHTRTSPAGIESLAQAAVDTHMSTAAPEWRRREGKHVLEFSWRHEGKDTALALLRSEIEADAVVFAGDDVTDEDALRSLEEGDLGIRVGAGDTVAHTRVDDPRGLVALLGRIADLRSS
jgi:alpha,alpha-trehalose-phosphate synthase [UDP-forming]/trehalose-phosphatase